MAAGLSRIEISDGRVVVPASCASCGGELVQVNDGHANPLRSKTIVRCGSCAREWMIEVVATLAFNAHSENWAPRRKQVRR